MPAALPLSGLWTWDHAMTWAPDLARVESGCMNRYLKEPASFVEDYRRAIEYMAETGLPYVIIWGLFRDSHGGERAAREVMRIGRANGVGVLAGVGINAYGGYYYEGDNPWSLEAWLAKHPDLAAVREPAPWAGTPHLYGDGAACPSNERNVRWHLEGMRWLMESFPDLAGVNLETGDYGICGCTACAARSAGRKGNWSFDDMAHVLPPIIETALALRPDVLVTYATYSGFTDEVIAHPPAFTEKIPATAACQWTATHMLHGGAWRDDPAFRPPTRRNTVLSHWGSQWTNPNTRFIPLVNHLRELCSRAARSGFSGAYIQGEVSGRDNVTVGINYDALAYFSGKPKATIAEFARERLADRFGDGDHAERAVAWLTEPADGAEIARRRADATETARAFAAAGNDVAAGAWRLVESTLFSRTL